MELKGPAAREKPSARAQKLKSTSISLALARGQFALENLHHADHMDRPSTEMNLDMQQQHVTIEQKAATASHEDNVVVRMADASKAFGSQIVADAINLTIKRGEFIALLGASGSGKTTLLRILAGLEVANSGNVEVTANRSVVFQEARLLPFRRVWRNVLLGKSRRSFPTALQALDEVGLSSKAKSWPKSLSGGEAQRVALARALVRAPELLLLDEPFAALDALTRIKMHILVQNLWAEHTPGVLLVTHDVDEAILLADRILVLKDGKFLTDLTVNAPRPRLNSSEEFTAIRRRLLADLGVTA